MENNIAENMCKTREKMKVKEHKTGNEKIESKRSHIISLFYSKSLPFLLSFLLELN